MLFSTFVLLSTLFAVNAVTLVEESKYVQKPSGSASFTMYSGCGSPGGDDNRRSHLGRPVTDFFLTIACGETGEWVHGSNEPTCLWCPTGPWACTLFLLGQHR